jgi:2-polyprenyl-6-methoxyphenol hydroxylase-like FAD-dependent oxidoreductase
MTGAITFANATHDSAALTEMEGRSVHGPDARYDALVVGKGPAACVFAIQMARRGKSILLVPPPTESNQRPWGETLAPRGEFLLGQLGLASVCLAGQYSTQTALSCWGSADPERTDFTFDPHGRMWHVSRPAFDKALQTHAIESGVDTLDKTSHRVAGFTRCTDYWEVRLASLNAERAIKVGYIVDATGKSSCIARLMGSKRIFRDQLVAISCVVEQITDIVPLLIEPVCKGWWYSLGLPQGQLLAVLMTDPKLFKLSTEARRSLWDAMLGEAPHTRKRAGTCENALGAASAESARLDNMSGKGWLAIGDAAMSFDPLSSHGLCSAIEQAVDSAERLSIHGHEAALVEFDAMRKELFGKYQAQRLAFYQSVRRFSGQEFWRNRRVH